MAKPERKFHKRYTLWVSEGEAKQLEEQASLAGFRFPNASGVAALAAGQWWRKRT